ncbi:hypothetical protein CRM22_006577 [Opisthorchis felineus]|uniref:Cyclin-dependent kinase 5 activator n=1 Tax=Opisthorchis felineus TaxID=147828 RepID=A0A4S2LT14_OPIFE|nr:hypothetical protein CRM22_006577 [Opisthorchis felineus]
MGTVLSNSSSAAHVETKSHQFHNECYLNDRASLNDLSDHLYPKRLLNRRSSNDYGDSSLLEFCSSRVTHNGCIRNSTYQPEGLRSRQTTLLATPIAPGSTGLKRIIFPGLSKKTKPVNPAVTVRKAQRSQSGTATFRDQCEETMGPVTPSIFRRRSRGNSYFSNYPHHHEMRNSGVSFSAALEDSEYQQSQHEVDAVQPYTDERRGSYANGGRTGTPYCGPHDSLKPMCTACKHLSISCYQPSPVEASLNAEPFAGLNSHIHTSDTVQPPRHVHFNSRRQFSEPNAFMQMSHAPCVTCLELLNQVPLVRTSPQRPVSNCECQHDMYIETERRVNPVCDSSGRIHQLQRCASSHSTSRRFIKGMPHKHSPPDGGTASSGNHPYHHSIPTHLGNPRIECSPSYRRDKKPYAFFSQLSINAASPTRVVGSPHPVIAHRVQSSVQPSPASNRIPAVPEEPQTSFGKSREYTGIHRRNTTVVEISPILPANEPGIEPKDFSWGKNLTKSLSCYALRFFSQHHQANSFRSRAVGKTDRENFPRSMIPRLRAEKGKRKVLEKSQDKKQPGISAQPKSGHEKCQVDWDLESSQSTLCQSVPWCDSRPVVLPKNAPSQACTEAHNPADVEEKRVSNSNQLVRNNLPKLYLSECQGHQTEHCLIPYSTTSYCGFKLECDLASQWMRKEGRSTHYRAHSVDPRQTGFKASTSELLRCLSFFVVARLQLASLNTSTSRTRSNRLRLLQPNIIVNWIRAVDRALLVQGWSELAFMNPANVVFLFMMLKDCLKCAVNSERELHTIVMACLYLSYSYMGNEISYPLKPFLIAETNQLLMENNNGNRKVFDSENALLNGFEGSIRAKVIDQVRNRFWQYCLRIINAKSQDMLHVNADSLRFTELFSELKSYDSLISPVSVPVRLSSTPK